MINNIQPNSIVKEDFDKAMRNFCKKVTFNSHEYYKNTKMSYRPVYKPAGGRKYIKVKSFETNTLDHNKKQNANKNEKLNDFNNLSNLRFSIKKFNESSLII